MPDELKPCPWCGSSEVQTWKDRATWGKKEYGEQLAVVFCNRCGREVVGDSFSVESAIAAWNALPRAPQWTKYDGTEGMLPPKDATVLLQRFSRSGSLFCEAATPCWFVHGGDEMCAEEGGGDFAQLIVGDLWMPWPGGEEK